MKECIAIWPHFLIKKKQDALSQRKCCLRYPFEVQQGLGFASTPWSLHFWHGQVSTRHSPCGRKDEMVKNKMLLCYNVGLVKKVYGLRLRWLFHVVFFCAWLTNGVIMWKNYFVQSLRWCFWHQHFSDFPSHAGKKWFGVCLP